jgi:hypothetical protein
VLRSVAQTVFIRLGLRPIQRSRLVGVYYQRAHGRRFAALYRALGRDAYYLIYWFLLSLQLLGLLLNIIGATILVRFLLRHESLSSAKT